MANTPNKSLIEMPFNNSGGTLPDGTTYTSWDAGVNYDYTVLDNALGGNIAISVGSVVTTQNFTLAQYQSLMINFSGALTVNLIYNFPTTVGGHWLIRNSCTGNFTLSVGTNGQTLVLPVGATYYVYIDTSTSPYISFLNTSSVRSNAGNPNTVLAGNAGNPASIVWDSTNLKFWVCTTTGIASTAVWTSDITNLLSSVNTWTAANTWTNTATFSKAANFNSSTGYLEQTLVVTTGTAAWDLSLGPNALVNLTVATTALANATNQAIGQTGIIRFLVDATSGRLLTFGTSYNIVSDAFWAYANRETEYFYKVVAASGVNSIELRAKTNPFVLYPSQATTSGTTTDFNYIPSWAKRITVLFELVSSNGNSGFLVQIGQIGVVETSGYTSQCGNSSIGGVYPTNCFGLWCNGTAANSHMGQMLINLGSANRWTETTTIGTNSNSAAGYGYGTKTITGNIGSLRFGTLNGTDTFDFGSVTILVEG